MKLLISNVKMVDAFSSKNGGLLIEDGRISRVIESHSLEGQEAMQQLIMADDITVIDGEGQTLMPSFIDLHSHLRYPGFEYKEDLESGQRAALKGGYTTLAAMANTKPVCDNPELLKSILIRSRALNLCDLHQVGAITKGLEGKELADFRAMLPYTRLFSDDGNTIFDEEIMKAAISAAEEMDFKILVHAQPETEIIARDIKLAEELKGSLHFCHISKEASLSLVKEAKARGLKISCEVTPHHLFAYGLDYRVNPSFRGEGDVKALLKGLEEGHIDMVATDHAPHSHEDKEQGAPGISSIEVAFSMVNTVFKENGLDISTLSRVMSHGPAKFLGLNSGLIKEGLEANLVLVNLNEEYEISTKDFISKGKNNPFNGAAVKGRVKMTIKRGQIMFQHINQ